MRVVDVEAVLVELPFRKPVKTVNGTTTSQRSILVRVRSDDGVEGWSDVNPRKGYTPMTADEIYSTVTALAPKLKGADAFNIRAALATMDGEFPDRLEAKAAIEMALFDLKGRALNQPLHSLLGGNLKQDIQMNGWIGAVSPAQAGDEAMGWVRSGFTTLKIKMAGSSDEGLERVAAVRAAVGPKLGLRVDFNESLSVDEAPGFIRKLEQYDLTFVEQPVARHEIEALARIRKAVGMPIMADESVTGPESLFQIIRREAADLVKLKVMKQGGLLRTLQLAECAEAAGLRVVIGHGFGLTLSTRAEAAVSAACPAVMDGCEAVGPLKMAADVVKEPVDLEHGVLHLNDAPGLGATIDPEAVRRYRVR